MLAGLSVAGVIIPHTAHERVELRRSRRHGAGRDGGRAGEAAADGGGKGKAKGRGKKNRKKETLCVSFLAALPTGVREKRAACFITRPPSLCLASCILCAGRLLHIPSHKRWQESEGMRA